MEPISWKILVDLITALTPLGWPISAVVIAWTFKGELTKLMGRARNLSWGDRKIEFALDELEKGAERAVEEASVSSPKTLIDGRTTAEQVILREASITPKVGLIRLASEITNILREIVAYSGLINNPRAATLTGALDYLAERKQISDEMSKTIKNFFIMRNKLVHDDKNNSATDDVIRAIDSGLKILKVMREIPHSKQIVYCANIDLYLDPKCEKRIEGFTGLILQAVNETGIPSSSRQIYPTSKTYYKKAMKVSWEWNMAKVLKDQAYYRDPDTDEVRAAWSSSAEFVGRDMDELLKPPEKS